MKFPLVSIICLCYNHESYLREALDSVLAQTYPHIEIIVVDDASTDNSVAIIKEYCREHPKIVFLPITANLGNCRAFNRGLALAKGAYIVDFATDDVLLPDRIAEQIKVFSELDDTYAAIYTDAELIDENSRYLGQFYQKNAKGIIKADLPTGYIFADILKRSFLCPPTLIFRRTVYDKLRGYDEQLAYEDFDFWLRSAREYKYYYLNKVLTKRRLHTQSLSQQVYKPHDRQLSSTVQICQKAVALLRTEAEKKALIVRVRSELRQAYFTEHFTETQQLFTLLQTLEKLNLPYRLLHWLNHRRIKLKFIRNWYYTLRYPHQFKSFN